MPANMDERTRSDEGIREGCYRFINVMNGHDLDLSDGDWKYGQVQVWERNSDDNSPGCRNQRWLVAQTPGDKTHLVINMYTGAIMAVFRGERNGGRQVKAGPVNVLPWWQRWALKQDNGDGDGSWSLYWREDVSKLLDCTGGERHGAALAYDRKDGTNQRWNLDGQGVIDDERRFTKWMSHVPGDTKLNMMNIPGTHQTLALHAVKGWIEGTSGVMDNPRCQGRSPYEQLMDGIRSFDCRFDRWTEAGESDCLYAYHGTTEPFAAAEGYTLLGLLMSLKIFLSRFPSETVIVGITNETKTDGFYQAFWNDFSVFLEYHPDKVFTYPRPAINDSNPKGIGDKIISDVSLDEVRGKIILLVNTDHIDGIHPSNNTIYATSNSIWSHESTPSGQSISGYMHFEYAWDLMDWDQKILQCETNTSVAKGDSNDENIYATNWNMSKAPFYNPLTFFNRAKPDILRIYGDVGTDGQYRVGMVGLDFYHEVMDAVGGIIRGSRGCGGL